MSTSLVERARATLGGAFVRSVAVLLSGTLLAQIITVATTPIFTRLFTPEDFGVLGLINAFAVTFVQVAAVRYDMAIVLPKGDEEAANVLALSLGLVVLVSAFVASLVLFGADRIASLLGFTANAQWLWVAPGIVFFSGVYNTLTYWCTRRKKFRRISVSALLSAAGSAGGKGLAGWQLWGAPGLVGGQVAGVVVAALVLTGQVLAEDYRRIRAALSFERVTEVAREYDEFPKYHAPLTWVTGLTTNLPAWLLGAFFTTAEVGHWSLTVLALSMPVGLLANAVRQVFMQRAAELRHQGGNLFRLQMKATFALLGVGLPFALLGMAIAPWLFRVVLGEQWVIAGHYARYLIPWQLALLVGAPSAALFPVLRMRRAPLAYQIFSVASLAGALSLGARSGDAEAAIAYFGGAGSLLPLGFILMVAWRARTIEPLAPLHSVSEAPAAEDAGSEDPFDDEHR